MTETIANDEGNGKEKVREIDYHAPVREFDNTKHLVTNIGFTAKSDEKYQVIWLIPTTDEECQARYDSPLSALIEAGVRQLSTRPDYKTVGFHDNGALKPEGHEAMQTLADGYEIGKRTAGAEEELGMTVEEMVEKMKAMKAAGMLDDTEPDETA
jgi:hypothetical protein